MRLRAYGPGSCGDLFRLNEFGGDPLWLLETQLDPARIVFVPAGTRPLGTRLARTRPPAPPGDSRAGRIALASGTAVNKGLLAQVPPVEAGLSAFKADVYWDWSLPRERLEGISSDLAIRRLAGARGEPPRSGWLPGTAVTSGWFRLSRVSSGGFHCRPDRGRPSHGLERSPPRLGRRPGRAGE